MILIFFCFVPRVLSEVSLQHVYVTRKSRSNTEPFRTEYVNHIGDSPGKLSSYHSSIDSVKHNNLPNNTEKYLQLMNDPYTYSREYSKHVDFDTVAKASMPKRDLNQVEKSKTKYSAGFLPSKIKTDAMYERLKSAMHYQPPFETETMFGYDTEYHIDDDDVRTSSRGMHDGWPYYYYNPYEYEHMRIEADREKAKDKRFAVGEDRIIPIHEDLSHDIPYSQEPLLTTTQYYYTSTDNPMSGHDPFFSFMLNDYFNKHYDAQDELTLKGIDWNEGNEPSFPEHGKERLANRIRRLPNDIDSSMNSKTDSNFHHSHNDAETATKSDSVTENGFNNDNKLTKHEKGDAKNTNNKKGYEKNVAHHTGFKNFVDGFANRFGSEDQKKDSKYVSKINQDKGENRKGFRRVYHKDEYQEDNEFYDNNNRSAQAEDKGSSNAHIGGSEGLLKSSAFNNLGNQASTYEESGKAENSEFENNHLGYDKNNGYNNQFHRYRDVAKEAAQSNDADYSSISI